MIARIGKKLLTADAVGGVLVLLGLRVMVYGIAESLQGIETASFFRISLLAAAIGYGLGRTRWKGIPASAVVCLTGLLLAWILSARLILPLYHLAQELLAVPAQEIRAIWFDESIDRRALSETWRVITEATSVLFARFGRWLGGLASNHAPGDGLVLGVFWMLALWLCSGWMGWFAQRRNAMAAFLPFLVVLALVTSYSGTRIETVWLMIILLPALLGIWKYQNHTRQWQRDGIDYSDSIGFDSGQAILFLTLLLGSLAFITPSVSWQDALEHVRQKQSEILGIQNPANRSLVTDQQAALPREYLLTGGLANSEQVVMLIRTNEIPPIFDQTRSVDAPRYYWRSAIYDRYDGAGWLTSTVTPQKIQADTPLVSGLPTGYRFIHLEVQTFEPEGRLFWTGILFSANVPFTADWRLKPASNVFADQAALLQADMFAASSSSTSYQAESYLAVPTSEDLRAASSEYPEEIRKRYLGLPGTVPERVHALARTITNKIKNPYDKARAIETFLRTKYPYDLDVPPPPEGRDVADFFLFDLKKGYCDYYASAMVVLARSSGLPARFVSGFSPGTYDARNAQYLVRELNAHSWAEIYFPEIGWIEFEPTASLPGIEHKDEGFSIPQDQANEKAALNLIRRLWVGKTILWMSPLLGLIILSLAYILVLEQWFYLRLAPDAAIERIYRKFYPAGRPLAGPRTNAETSTEFMNRLIQKVVELGSRTHFNIFIRGLADNANTLTGLYHSSLFLPSRTNRRDAHLAWKIWKRLRLQLFAARLIVLLAMHRK